MDVASSVEHRAPLVQWRDGFRWQIAAISFGVALLADALMAILALLDVLPVATAVAIGAALTVPALAVGTFLAMPRTVALTDRGLYIGDEFVPWGDVHLYRVRPDHYLQLQLHHSEDHLWVDSEALSVHIPYDLHDQVVRAMEEHVPLVPHPRHELRGGV